MQRKQQYEKDFDSYKHNIKLSEEQMLKSVEAAAKHKEHCLNNSTTFELFATCMEQYEGKVDNIANFLSIRLLFIERQALQCYKSQSDEREYELCHQKVEQDLHNCYNEYYQGLLNL
ncbi:unnamed protein product [Paramecium primaurelia]|uniref:Uncharacterized protein n=1 Tax=Paramecium primaurelia TaxID=5886 RepID=A0A8S1QBC5_PARPR|nr:unnamed protein product [Paramecium primaurelia]